MSPLGAILVSLSTVLAAGGATAAREEALIEHQRFRIEVPPSVLTDVPVRKIVIRALDANGNPDATFSDQPLITGIRLSVPQTDDAKLGPFKNGVLELTTDLHAGRKVYVSEPEIVVDAGERRSARLAVHRTLRWLSLVPAVIAFLLCLWPRHFLLSMFLAIIAGTAILEQGNLFRAFVQTIDSFFLVDLPQGTGEASHLTMLAVMLLFGSLFAVIAAGGGLSALSDRLGRYATGRERGQLITLLFGFLTFLNDFAHPLVVGKTLQPLSDRLKISREKLAFLVDTTAAPVAALAVVSTWIAAERGTIRAAFAGVGLAGDATTTLVASLPYCFYPILMLIFAALVIFVGHDFGPMFRAEWRAAVDGNLSRPDLADPLVAPAVANAASARRPLARNAWLPIGLLLVSIAAGLWWTGWQATAAPKKDSTPAKNSTPPTSAATNSPSDPSTSAAAPVADGPSSWLDVLEQAKPLRVLLFSAFLASVAAVVLAVLSRSLTLQHGLDAWVLGLERMVPAALLLILSWSFQRVCDADHLNTAGFLMEIGQPRVTVEWMPLVAFLVVALISFLAGSSWAALPLALPLFITATNRYLVDLNEADSMHPLLLATIGAVIAGTVFGRHCSPISETTILASASSSCSHLDHVFTQAPYAVTVAGVAALFGYAPVAYGYSPVVLLPTATVVLFVLLQLGGRPVVPQSAADAAKPAQTAASVPDPAGRPEKGAKPPLPAEEQKLSASGAAH